MQFSQTMGHQQFQSRQLPCGHVQHGMGQSQLSQGNQLNRHLSQFSGGANNALFNAAQGTPSTQMVSYIYFFSCFPFHVFIYFLYNVILFVSYSSTMNKYLSVRYYHIKSEDGLLDNYYYL